jgi:hypothetical protein
VIFTPDLAFLVHTPQGSNEMRQLAFYRQLAIGADPLAHELPEGHVSQASRLHGLLCVVCHEGDQDQSGNQDERQEQGKKHSKGGKQRPDHRCL